MKQLIISIIFILLLTSILSAQDNRFEIGYTVRFNNFTYGGPYVVNDSLEVSYEEYNIMNIYHGFLMAYNLRFKKGNGLQFNSRVLLNYRSYYTIQNVIVNTPSFRAVKYFGNTVYQSFFSFGVNYSHPIIRKYVFVTAGINGRHHVNKHKNEEFDPVRKMVNGQPEFYWIEEPYNAALESFAKFSAGYNIGLYWQIIRGISFAVEYENDLTTLVNNLYVNDEKIDVRSRKPSINLSILFNLNPLGEN